MSRKDPPVKRPTPMRTKLCAKRMGESLSGWRRMLRISSQELADRAGVSRETISRLENGDSSVSFATVLNVCGVLGILDRVQDAVDPYETDLGRARADQLLPQRIRG